MDQSTYLSAARCLQGDAVRLRRLFHQYPEASKGEVNTNRLIRAELDSAGIAYLAPEDNITIALLPGARPGKTAAIRSDTDAIEVVEMNDTVYRSRHDGLMHACGHDAHMAMGLVAARLLHQRWEARSGLVKVIFQPAEEGAGGALRVMDTGLVDDVEAFYALHVWPLLATGMIRLSPGPVCAGTDLLRIDVQGAGGHGAYPELCRDAVAASAAIITALQHVVSREIPALEPAVLTIGSIRAGTRWNVIAGSASMEGTIRTFSAAVRDAMTEKVKLYTKNTAAAHGCTADVEVTPVCRSNINDGSITALAARSAEKVFGAECCLPQEKSMIGDDFSEYSAIAPGCYAFLGIDDGRGAGCLPLHHNRFSLDENALQYGAAWLAEAADRFAAGND